MLFLYIFACIGNTVVIDETGYVSGGPCGETIAQNCCLNDVDEDGYCADDPSDPKYDCDDYNMDIHPNAEEECNGVDDNCVDGVDEGCR